MMIIDQTCLQQNLILESPNGLERIRLLYPDGSYGRWFFAPTSYLGSFMKNDWRQHHEHGIIKSLPFAKLHKWRVVLPKEYSIWEQQDELCEVSEREAERLNVLLSYKSWLVNTGRCKFIAKIVGVACVRDKLIIICDKNTSHELPVVSMFTEDTGQFIVSASCPGVGPLVAA